MDHERDTILITGATGAIGSALARRLAGGGYRLALCGRDIDRLQHFRASLPDDTVVYAVDVTDHVAVETMMLQLTERFGPIAGLAHCVGSVLLRPLHLTTLSDWERQIALNLNSAFHVLKAFVAQALKASRPGAAVLTSSLVAQAGFPNHEAVAAAKAGVAALAMTAAATYADKGIRVNAVMPGLTRSSLSARLTGTPEAEARSAALNPMGRIGEPEDIANAIRFLLSDEAGWITGQCLTVDGGQAKLHPLPKAR